MRENNGHETGHNMSTYYGHQHRRIRAQWKKRIDAGEPIGCSRCGEAITRGMPFDLDHTDDRLGYLGPAHQSCNRRAGPAKRDRQRRMPTSRDW